MKAGKTIIVLVTLLIAVSTVAVAFNDDDYNFAYKQGYMEGYTDQRGNLSSTALENKAKNAAHSYYGRTTTDENRPQKSAFKNGYIQGWNDKKNGVPNRYLND